MSFLDLLAIKLAVTPVLMLVVSLAVRKWGGFVGGLLSGMPLTSGPVALFLAIEQGPQFAAKAASGALSGLAAVLLTYLFYLVVAGSLSVSASCVGALVFFGVISLLLSVSGSPVGAIIISLVAIAVIIRLTNRGEQEIRKSAVPFWDIPLRMLTSTALLFAITGSAHIIGPHISGILSPFPVIAWPLTVFAHLQGGRSEMAAVVRGNAVSAIGVIIFYVTIRELILQSGLLTTFVVAFTASVLTTTLLAEVMRRSAQRERLVK
ncbi:hypothetical protein BIY26_20330 [Brenneria goodwinii]|uniref:Uncharacterized protein n=1 Tax=Brenneria goodwinii TaxID=1109412 RepID=A0AAE8EPM4_9GAMM|nr:hypothetical protein [Brenneria goodwinii]ATA23250.1 hypothetical protein AWC36_03550 [Brenneria goodwinii]RLM17585.1 hypothetical protein BIY26_20330 [Brenneria goodwinii]